MNHTVAKETTKVNDQVISIFYFGGVGAAKKWEEINHKKEELCSQSEGSSDWVAEELAKLGYTYRYEELISVCEHHIELGYATTTIRVYRITETFQVEGEQPQYTSIKKSKW
jgi:hypothetical protein